MNRIIIESELLLGLYWGNQYSQSEIGTILNLPRSTIQKKMIKYDIPRRTRGDANKGNPKCSWSRGLTKETDGRVNRQSENLKQQYKDGKKIITQWVKGMKKGDNFYKFLCGEEHPLWKNNSTMKNYGKKGIRLSVDNKTKEWRTSVFKRDNYTCRICNQKSGDINAHHIKRFIDIINDNNITTSEEARGCEELWDIKNGITLCYKCHQKVHHKGVRIDI